jgi:colicin import membrane protein
MISEALVKR